MRSLLLAFAIVTSSTLSGCVHLLFDDISSESIQGPLCVPRCNSTYAEFRPDGTLQYGSQLTRYKGGSDIFARLPLNAVIGLSERPRRVDPRSISIDVGYRGRPGVFASIPADATHDDAAMAAVRAWAIEASTTAREIAIGGRIRALRSAIVEGARFGGVKLRVFACASPCLSYEVNFQPNGIARFTEYVRFAKFRKRLAANATARISVTRVRAALATATAQEMEPLYDCCSRQGLHAEVKITAGRATYTTYGGNVNGWGPELGATVAHLNELMLAAHWTPALPLR